MFFRRARSCRRSSHGVHQGVEGLQVGGLHRFSVDAKVQLQGEKTPDTLVQPRLGEAAGLVPALWDERRTTVDAHRLLFQAGRDGKKRKKTVDAVAASLILEGYLTFRRQERPAPAGGDGKEG